jgi:hypothetical protein
MHLRFQHRDHRGHLGLDDQLEVQKAHQNHPDEGHQSLGRQLGEVRLDEAHQHPVGVVHLGVEHQRPVGVVHLDVVYPCPGLKKMGYFLVLPLAVGYPCPGLKKTDCFQDVECQLVECSQRVQPELLEQPVPQVRRALQVQTLQVQA